MEKISKRLMVGIAFFLALSLVTGASYHGNINIDANGGIITIEDPAANCITVWNCEECKDIGGGETVYWCVDSNECKLSYDTYPSEHGTSCTLGDDTTDPGDGGSPSGGGNPSGGGSPTVTTTSSSTGCIENWECTEWSICMRGESGRECEDVNNCDAERLKPETTQVCVVAEGDSGFAGRLSGITGAVVSAIQLNPEVSSGIGALIVIALGTGLFILIKKKKKK